MKKIYKVPVTWVANGTLYVAADSEEAAKQAVYAANRTPVQEGFYDLDCSETNLKTVESVPDGTNLIV